MTEKIPGKAVFAGCARNCATQIADVLKNVEAMADLFEQSAFVFVENDSVDDTRQVLERWCASRNDARLIAFDGPLSQHRIRCVRLAAARNLYLSLVKSDYAAFDYLFMLDCDEVNTTPLATGLVRRALTFLQENTRAAAVFANTEGYYYDLWAMRHPELCPRDIWEDVYNYAVNHQVSDSEAYDHTFAKRIFSLDPADPPLSVDSAFGGLGIYKIKSILENKRDYVGYKEKTISTGRSGFESGAFKKIVWETCEHVSFHSGLREKGDELLILPYLVNFRKTSLFFPSAWRKLIFEPPV